MSCTSVTCSGTITAAGNIIAGYSDDRLKDRNGFIVDALDRVSRLTGFYYTPNKLAVSLGVVDPAQRVGLSAQSVEAVMPEAVYPSALSPEYLTVDYAALVPLLIEAIKELRVEVQMLKGRYDLSRIS